MTVSLDGPGEVHDRLRPSRAGRAASTASCARVAPLLARQRADAGLGARHGDAAEPGAARDARRAGRRWASTASGSRRCCARRPGRDEMAPRDLRGCSKQMIACGLEFERRVAAGRALPVREHGQRPARDPPGHAPARTPAARARATSASPPTASSPPATASSATPTGRWAIAPASTGPRQTAWLADRHVHRQEPCRSLLGALPVRRRLPSRGDPRGRPACDYIRGWLHYTLQAYGRLARLAPGWFEGESGRPTPPSPARSVRPTPRSTRWSSGPAPPAASRIRLLAFGYRVALIERLPFPAPRWASRSRRASGTSCRPSTPMPRSAVDARGRAPGAGRLGPRREPRLSPAGDAAPA